MDLTTGIERIHNRGKGNPLEALGMELNRAANCISLHYSPTTLRAFFDVCNPEGKVLHTQALLQEPVASWSFAKLPKGDYQLFVVDGDNMMRYQFTI